MNAVLLVVALLAATAGCATPPQPSQAAKPAGPGAASAGEPQRWRGEFVYFADAANFTDCASGKRWQVAMSGGYLAAERAYLQQRSAPQAPLLVSFQGRVEVRPAMEGAPKEHMIIERFDAAEPGARCGSPAAASPPGAVALTGTDWQLIDLDGQPAPPAPAPGRTLHLRFDSEGSRVSGFTGCNRLIGGFDLAGPALRFKQLGSTRMACVGPAADIEPQMLKMLASVSGWRIEGARLQLLEGDRVRARFAAARP